MVQLLLQYFTLHVNDGTTLAEGTPGNEMHCSHIEETITEL